MPRKRIKISIKVINPELPPRDEIMSTSHLVSGTQTRTLVSSLRSCQRFIQTCWCEGSKTVNDVDSPGNMTADCLHDALNFLSLPPHEKAFVLQGSEISSNDPKSPPLQISIILQSQTYWPLYPWLWGQTITAQVQSQLCTPVFSAALPTVESFPANRDDWGIGGGVLMGPPLVTCTPLT